MSNNMSTPPTIRWQLLSTVSALALLGSAYTAAAADADRPLIWIELGGQMENISGQGEVFAPAFLAANSGSSVLSNGVTPLQAQKPPKFSFGEDGKISFQPEGSDWVFSAAIRYGRSSSSRDVDHQTKRTFTQRLGLYYSPVITTDANFADTRSQRRESHAILDFAVGKDVGLGLFGKEVSSTVNLGVRFAQFTNSATFDIRARPDLTAKYALYPQYYISIALPHFHNYHATGQASRSLRGVGPSLSWNGSAPLVGNPQDGELTFDWGADAALLFGKQKARVRHQESAQYEPPRSNAHYYSVYQHPPHGHDTDRSVTVPNVGGSVGLSWRVQDFKVSMGYRADFFFGAMDTGIDLAKKSNLTFNGPYASISIGFGD